ncbi:MAG: hypothetical protein QM579_13875 [Desulfovibrio sp.]|uniref:beta strand repeat-containing protein n=1 Tax=Desulfovibrio sp. TaxID=885 RepID=UPI0039E248EF
MNIITINRPQIGQHAAVSTTSDARYTLDFPSDQATLSRAGNDLVFSFDDASSIRLTDFYSEYTSENIPDFEVGGTLIAGKDFFSALAPDLAPAAGPSSAERGSHYAEHGNAELAAGVGHLDGLDYSTGDSAFQSVSPLMSDSAVSDRFSSGSGSPDGPGGPGGETGSSTYHTRLIVSATSQNTFSFFAVNQSGDLVDDPSQISWAFEGPNAYFNVTGIGADGKITVELTTAGLAALNNGTLASDMLLITIDGVEYKMPLVISGGTAGQSYDAATEEDRAQLDGPLKAEWYASDARTVSGESVTLGGTNYNQVDIDRSDAGGASQTGVWNSDIDITASAKGAVNITAEHNTGNAHGLATYGTSGQASSSVRGGDESSIHIAAKTTGAAGTARGVYTNSNEGAVAATTIEGGDISIEAHGNEAGAYGVYSWAAGGREASTTIKASHDLTITADSSKGGSSGPGNTAVYATGSGAKIVISSGPDGKLQVGSHLDNSTQENFNVEKGGSFAVSGISAYNGGQVSATGADINISSDVSNSSAHGTATAVYAGYGNAKTTINGYDDRDNHMEFSASAPDHAMAVIGTNSGTVAINGGSGDDTIKISSEAKSGSSFGVAAQAGGQVLINGNGGHDELHIDAKFNGPAKPGTTELFDGNRGAYGMASAWGGAWVKVDGIETVNITADASGSGGSAYGMYTHGNGWGAADGNIIKHDGSLQATISGYADNSANGHAMHASGGTNIIQGGSRLGDANGDRITLNGHMTAAGYNGKNLVTTGDGDDIVTLNGDMAIKNVANDGMQNKIETGLGNDIVRISGDMVTNRDSGQNIINVGAGDNLVEVSGSMHGVGANSITLGSGNSTVNLGGNMFASGLKSTNSIQGDASGNTVVNVNGQGIALYAAAGGKNSISAVHDVHADSGGIYSTGNGSSNTITDIAGAVTTTMLTANDGSRNDITNVGSLDIQSVGNGVAGVTAGRNATNNIEANGGIDISAQSTSGGTWGLMAGSLGGNATNSLKGGADINITATGNGTSASAIDNNSGNTTNVESTGGDVTLKATSTTSAAGGIWGIGTTTITAGKDLTIEASTQGADEARGVHTGGTTTLTAQDGDVAVRAEGNVATGLYTISTGTTNVSASGLVDIQAHGNSGSNNTYGGNATALYAESQNTGQLARNIIEGGEVSIAAKTLQNGGTYALYSNTALNKITSDTQATVTAENLGTGNTWGMYATATNNKLGANEITGHDVTVTSSAANGNAYGMQAASTKGDSSNTVTLTGGSADVSAASAQGNATAMHATGRGTNTITGNGDVTVSGTATGGYGIGMSAEASGKNSIIAGTGDVTVSGTGTSYGMGMRAQHASNTIETTDGNVNVSGSASGSSPGYGMSASDFGNNTITTGSGSVTVSSSGGGIFATSSGSNSIETKSGDVSVSGSGGYGMAASYSGSNTINTESGNVTVSGPGGSGDGMRANFAGSNSITTESGNVTVSGSRPNYGGGMDASGAGSSNAITTKSGDVAVSGANGMYALSGSSNTIITESGDVAVSGLLNGMTAGGSGSSNSITTKDGDVEVSSTSATTIGNYGAGMYVTTSLTATGDSNSITTESGDVKVTSVNTLGSGYGMHGSVYDGNTITTNSGDVTVSGANTESGGIGVGMAGHNEIKTQSGDVTVTGTGEYSGYGMYGFGSKITTESGSVEVTGTSAKSSAGMSANSALGGSNEINTQSGDVTVTGTSGTSSNYGMSATNSGSNSIITKSGSITVAGNGASDTASGAVGMDARSSGSNTATNIITTESGAVTVSGNAGGSSFGMYANGSGSSNKIDSQSGNVKVVGTSTGTNASNTYGYGAGMYTSRGSNEISTQSGTVEIIGAHADSSASNAPGYGMYASDSGSNTITTGSGAVTVSSSSLSGSSYGMAASASGSNTIQSSGDALTVTITATADAASKAIAMWASGGGSVNYITGHSQAGGAGDSITLNANNGQGIAMQALSGGKNIITTGAGDDSVTINGAVKGIGNEINLGSGDNTITINGSVQTGSLNVAAAGGTYTLILQASDAESFAVRYGAWLNTISSDPLIAGGMNGISFDGLDISSLPADFLSTFNDLLWSLHGNGVSIEPPALVDQLHDPAAPAAAPLFAMDTEAGAEHHTQDAQHAAGHDDSQDSQLSAHDGPAFTTDDSLHTAFSAQASSTAAHADGLEPDATAQIQLDENREGEDSAVPLFSFLDDFEGGDDALHDGYLSSEGSDVSFAGLHAPISLIHGDENLDSLLVATGQQAADREGTDVLYGGSTAELHDMGLTDIKETLDQGGLAESASLNEPAFSEGTVAIAGQGSMVPSVMDSCQEATDSAAREMSNT